ncbi:MAG: HNH endonuclease, partial [Pirellula sp.]
NPRLDDWDTHFDWDDVTLIAKTEIGRVTIKALDLNHERRIRIRRAEQLFGLFPPERTSE